MSDHEQYKHVKHSIIIGSMSIPVTYIINSKFYKNEAFKSGLNSLYYAGLVSVGSYFIMKELENKGLH